MERKIFKNLLQPITRVSINPHEDTPKTKKTTMAEKKKKV